MAKGTVFLRDYQHASKIFRTDLYRNAPKFKFLFHVYFDINPNAYSQNSSTGANFGLLVKTVKLPGFNIAASDLNQYNRKRLIQTKVRYDPVDITFHDDNGNMITKLWIKYFTYYFYDIKNLQVELGNAAATEPALAGETSYNVRTQYYDIVNPTPTTWSWGFNGDTREPYGSGSMKPPFFRNITIYGLEGNNFTAYTLINPIITRFNHDTYNYSDGAGTMEHSMTVNYETVVYNEGSIDLNNPTSSILGFADNASYDNTPSPWAPVISNPPPKNPNQLAKAMAAFNTGQYAQALSLAGLTGTAYNNLNGPVSPAVQADIKNAILNSFDNTRQRNVDIPIYGSTPTVATTNAGLNTTTDTTSNAGSQVIPPV